MGEMKGFLADLLSITHFFALPDYLVLMCIFLAILLVFLFGIALRFSILVFLIFFFISSVLVFASPFIYQYIMESYVRKIEFTLIHNKSLQYDKAYYVEGNLKNIGFLDFRGCVVRVDFIPKGLKKIARLKYEMHPKYFHVQTYKMPLAKQETMDFKFVIPSPNPALDFTLKTTGACY